jgi:acetyl esterase/lipase
MYMAGYDDEERFDEEVVRDMTVRGHLGKIGRPTLLATGEYDPLCPLEDAIEAFEELKSAREMCVFENQHHILWGIDNLGGLDGHDYFLDWLTFVFHGKGIAKNHKRIAYIKEGGNGPWGDCEWAPTVKPGQAYF